MSPSAQPSTAKGEFWDLLHEWAESPSEERRDAIEHRFKEMLASAQPSGAPEVQPVPAIVGIERRVRGGSMVPSYQVRLAIGVQSFDVNYVGTWDEANFTADMLRKALARATAPTPSGAPAITEAYVHEALRLAAILASQQEKPEILGGDEGRLRKERIKSARANLRKHLESGLSGAPADTTNALQKLIGAAAACESFAWSQICTHESTHRGGVLWTICEACDAMWADDRGGMPEWKDPPALVKVAEAISEARAALAGAPAVQPQAHGLRVLNAYEVLERAALGPESPGTAAQFLECLGEGGMWVIANPLTPLAVQDATPMKGQQQ